MESKEIKKLKVGDKLFGRMSSLNCGNIQVKPEDFKFRSGETTESEYNERTGNYKRKPVELIEVQIVGFHKVETTVTLKPTKAPGTKEKEPRATSTKKRVKL